MDKITPTQLREQAQKMIADGTMPPLEKLLAAVAKSRSKYSKKIVDARHESESGASALSGKKGE